MTTRHGKDHRATTKKAHISWLLQLMTPPPLSSNQRLITAPGQSPFTVTLTNGSTKPAHLAGWYHFPRLVLNSYSWASYSENFSAGNILTLIIIVIIIIVVMKRIA